jgi:hypothetical protein
MVLEVTYDLHNPGRDYANVIAALKKCGSWAHPQGSVWLVDTAMSAKQIVDVLVAAGDANDEYLVTQLRHNVAWRNMNADVEAWLRDPGRTW